MRTTKSLVLTAVWLAASGCMKTQNQQAAPQPVATRAPSEATESAQAQPGENETTPPSSTAPQTTPPQGPAAGAMGSTESGPGGAAQGQNATRVGAHDLVSGALACAAAPVGAAPGSKGGGAGSTPSGSMDQECSGLASMVGVPVQALRTADRSATNEIRSAIEKVATAQSLSSSMRDQVLSLFDKGMAAARERSEAQGVVMRLGGATGGGPAGNSSGMATPPAGGSTTGSTGGHARTSSARAGISSSDAETLRMHDRLRDLVQFAHGSNAGSLSSEAEGLAWLIAAERFMSTAELPPKLKVLAAEPLFDTLLGVPAPAAAKGNPQAFSNRAWTQYLSAASRAAREGGAGGASGVGGAPPASGGMGAGGASSGGGTTNGAGRSGRAGTEMNDWRQVVGLLQQRIDAFAQQIPPSDLRQTLAAYAQELRGAAVGGGPEVPGSMSHPMHMQHPTPQSAPGTPMPSGHQPRGGAANPAGGTGTPGGGSSQPGGGD